MFGPPAYEHTQGGWIHWILFASTLPMLVTLCLMPSDPVVCAVMPLLAILFMVLAYMFRQLTVRDGSDELVVEFGPLHLFRKRVAYADIAEVSTARSNFIDGWGIHYLPGRGCIWNISGYDCVLLKMKDNSKLRIGTDESAKLCEFLQAKLQKA